MKVTASIEPPSRNCSQTQPAEDADRYQHQRDDSSTVTLGATIVECPESRDDSREEDLHHHTNSPAKTPMKIRNPPPSESRRGTSTRVPAAAQRLARTKDLRSQPHPAAK